MATAGVLLPRIQRPPVPSPSLQTAISQLGPLAAGKVLWEDASATEGPGLEEINIQVWGRCSWRKHTRVRLVRGFPAEQAGDPSLFPEAKQLFLLGMFRAQE